VKAVAEYQKAYICPYRNGRPALEEKFYVQFNPTEITINEAIGVLDNEDDYWEATLKKWLKGDGTVQQSPLETSSAQKSKNQLTLSVTLFFNTLTSLYQDSYEDVRKYIRQLYPYTNKTADDDKKIEQIHFFWGSIAVAGTLSRMDVQYTMFAPDGKPVRAQVGISITGSYVGEKTGGTVKSVSTGTAAGIEGYVASVVAAADDPSLWRTKFSGTGNPRL